MSRPGIIGGAPAFGLVLLAACASTSTPPADTGQSEFLGDISGLERIDAPRLEGASLYRRPGFRLGDYDRFYIRRPIVFLRDGTGAGGLDPDELKEIADYFYEYGTEKIGERYTVVDGPEPGALVVRIAITDVEPVSSAANVAGKLALKFVTLDLGGAAIEGEFIDVDSGERVLAIIDRRAGERFGFGMGQLESMQRWGHARQAFRAWAESFRARLDELHDE